MLSHDGGLDGKEKRELALAVLAAMGITGEQLRGTPSRTDAVRFADWPPTLWRKSQKLVIGDAPQLRLNLGQCAEWNIEPLQLVARG